MRNEAREHLQTAVTQQVAAQADGRTMKKHLAPYIKLARGKRPPEAGGKGSAEDFKRRFQGGF